MLKVEYLIETDKSAEEFVKEFVAWIEERGEHIFGVTQPACPECGSVHISDNGCEDCDYQGGRQ